ncbi:CapA family protein [Paenibacillus qinlingensis]|uniref:CapA family protein n=1 Tax=Paenibacillus qinlingensis TaxID=1837343 RepID=UPI001566407F|nr:CapA family protein [Paenibacillus qinlingensis]NQX59450.1 CapA family protein [Paenibacillus qinlingensis]
MKLALLGDIALIGKYDTTKNSDVRKRLKHLSLKLEEYDFVIGNLETPLTNETKTLVCKSMHLKTSTINAELLKYLHIDAVSLANNHVYDYGRKGFVDTINTLNNNNIEWFGANLKYLTKVINGEKVSFSGYCCYSTNASGYIEGNKQKGINLLNYNNVMKQIAIDKDNDSFSIMSFHWGDEHTNYPKYEHKKFAEQIAVNNDVVICGHHPHVIQGIQKFNNSLVAYSLGNFIFDDCTSITGGLVLKQNESNKKSFILEIEIKEGQIIDHKYLGFKEEGEQFVFYDIEDEIQELSNTLNKIESIDIYEENRRFQIDNVRKEKFGDRNLNWLISRMNYYSLGAYITAKVRRKKYLKEVPRFLDGS